MRFKPLTMEERAAQGFTHRLDINYDDIPTGIAVNTSTTFNTAPLPVLKAGDIVKRILIHLNPAFSDASDAAFNSTTLSVGDAGSATRYANAVQININGTEVITTFPGATENNIYTADSQLVVTLNSMAAKTLSDLDIGKLYILFNIERAGTSDVTAAPPYGTGWT